MMECKPRGSFPPLLREENTIHDSQAISIKYHQSIRNPPTMINIIEECRASPPLNTVAELTLPLTFFDVPWINAHETQRLLFYTLPLITKSSFIDSLIPNLKTSLSLTLQHYLPLSGNLVSSQHDVPFLRYMFGDSVPLVFAESSANLDRLAGNQPRNCEDFYPLIPKLPPPVDVSSDNSKITPLFAIQVTLFPNSGIAIGCTIKHVIGDGNVVVGFTRAWASINKFDGDSRLIASNSLPFYDRSVIKDPNNLRTTFLNHLEIMQRSQFPTLSTRNMVRSTFVLRKHDFQKLKNHVSRNRSSTTHLSTFTVTCAFIWTCWLKTKDVIGETTANDREADFFLFPMDCRSRLDPPIPATYFGNCLIPCYVKSTHAELVTKDGFLSASELIGAAIHKTVNDKEGILNGSVFLGLDGVNWKRTLSVAGTPKYDTYDSDFGWGKPEKYECVSIDIDGAMSLNKSGREENALEVGLSMPGEFMNAFGRIFTTELGNL